MAVSKETLDKIHELLAADMLDRLENGTNVVDKETGEVEKVSISAAELNVIRQFLKDNGIDKGAAPKGDDPMRALVEAAQKHLPPALRQ
jgi:hypothetical protein